jgi:sterol desaturase/sphingolipid hydroxylase (fatty acid hydroxylase superfamily)
MDTLATILFPGSLVALVALDLLRPARALVRVRGWRLRGALGFLAYLVVATLSPMLWDAWLGEHRLIDATAVPLLPATALAVLTVTFVSYWWHRALHRVPLLWRSHQMHHSAERIDVFGAFWFHPFDAVSFTFVGSFAMVMLVGVSAEAALLANSVVGFLAAFQHANLRTPRWLGWVVQRPESHAAHHERDVHAYNYGDIAVWDLLFGTFRNPARCPAKAGYYDGASRRVGAMLLGLDVTRPAA